MLTLFIVGGATAASAQDAAADAAQDETSEEDKRIDEARRRFRQGLALARSGDCAAAVSEFEASYALVPRANTTFNIAQCHEELFRYDLAVKYYEEYLATAPEEDRDRPSVEATLKSLRKLLGTIEVRSNVRAEVWVGDRMVGHAPGEILVPGGRHQVEIRRDDYLPVKRDVSVAGQERVTIDVTLEQAQKTVEITNEITKVEKKGLKPTLFWSGVGTTVAMAAVGAGFGIKALRLRKDQRAVDPRASDIQESIRDDAKKKALMADIFLGAAGAFAIGTTVIYFLTDFDKKKDTQERATRLTPEVGRNGGGLSLQGRF